MESVPFWRRIGNVMKSKMDKWRSCIHFRLQLQLQNTSHCLTCYSCWGEGNWNKWVIFRMNNSIRNYRKQVRIVKNRKKFLSCHGNLWAKISHTMNVAMKSKLRVSNFPHNVKEVCLLQLEKLTLFWQKDSLIAVIWIGEIWNDLSSLFEDE